jgi:hypothetical protein
LQAQGRAHALGGLWWESVWLAPGSGTVMAVRWAAGERAIDFLLERGRLERVAVDVEAACDALLERAAKPLETARAPMTGEDWEGALANAYDVYRMAAEVLFERMRQGRHASQYFDPARPEKTDDDALWAVDLADGVLASTEALLRSGRLDLY